MEGTRSAPPNSSSATWNIFSRLSQMVTSHLTKTARALLPSFPLCSSTVCCASGRKAISAKTTLQFLESSSRAKDKLMPV